MVIPQRGGLPHSDIHGSKPARGSPWLFAACHVLHRLLVPRHPPNALLTLHIRQPATRLAPSKPNQQAGAYPPCTGTITALAETEPAHAARHHRTQHSHTTPLNTVATPGGTTLAPQLCRPSDPFRSDSHPAPRRTHPAQTPTRTTCQAKRNRVVLRAQERTRTRFTTQRTNSTRPSHRHRPTLTRKQHRQTLTDRGSHPMKQAPAPHRRTSDTLETIGFEPMTPCLQSRCSTN